MVYRFLSNRKQYVKIGNIKLKSLMVNCGIPQCSIVGSLLFHMYIDDIVSVSDVANIIMFADDTNLFFSGSYFNYMSTLLTNS